MKTRPPAHPTQGPPALECTAGTARRQPAEPGARAAPGLKLRDCLIRRVLGEGGFGIVYLADDLNLARDVAVKGIPARGDRPRSGDGRSVVLKGPTTPRPSRTGSELLNEARLLGRFDHPALVKVYRYWEDNGTGYMAMPYYEGPTLRRRHAPPARRRPRPTSGLADAAAGRAGDDPPRRCYHRDIAPDNILLTKRGPVLLDFGAARRVIGDLTHTLTAVLARLRADRAVRQHRGLQAGPVDRPLRAGQRAVLGDHAREAAGVDRPHRGRPPEAAVHARRRRLPAGFPGRHRPGAGGAAGVPAAVGGAVPRPAGQRGRGQWAGMPRTPSLLRPTSPQAFGAASLSATPNNLPRQRTSFVGPRGRIGRGKALLDASALVTVLGMGGMARRG